MLLIDFINVGYGDCILIRELWDGQTGFAMLIDCGDANIPKPPGSLRISAAEFLDKEGVKELDLLLLTHLHLDHVGGMEQLLDRVCVKSFWCNHYPPEKHWRKELVFVEDLLPAARNLLDSYNIYLRCLKRLKEQGISVNLVRGTSSSVFLGPRSLHCGVFCGPTELSVRQDAVWQTALNDGARSAPLMELEGYINNTSIRLRLIYESFTFELPGDTYASYWQCKTIPSCTVLKLPHHGHKDSFTDTLAYMLRPTFAVISVSNDRTDDCPSRSVLEKLRCHTDNLLFTDAVGVGGRASFHSSVRFQIEDGSLMWEYHCV